MVTHLGANLHHSSPLSEEGSDADPIVGSRRECLGYSPYAGYAGIASRIEIPALVSI